MLFSTYQAAKKLGISVPNLYRYIEQKKLPAPEAVRIGNRDVRSWTEEDIERVRQILPKIANGRKTRYKKKHSAVSSQQSAEKKHSAGSTQQSARAKSKNRGKSRSKKKKT